MKAMLTSAIFLGVIACAVCVRAADDDDTTISINAAGGGFGHGAGRSATTRPANNAAHVDPGDTIPPVVRALGQFGYEKLMVETPVDAVALGLTKNQSAQIESARRTHELRWSALLDKYHDQLLAINANELAVANAIQGAVAIGGSVNPNEIALELQKFDKFEPYYRQRLEIFRAHREAILAALRPEQRVKWQEVPVRQGLDRRLRGVALTPAQQGVADKLCRDVSTQILALPEPLDVPRVRRVMDDAWKRFRLQTLTPDQRQQCEPTVEEQITPVK